MSGWEIVGFVVLLLGFAAVIGLFVLFIRLCLLLIAQGNRPRAPRPPSPPEDWDDEEFIARHHH